VIVLSSLDGVCCGSSVGTTGARKDVVQREFGSLSMSGKSNMEKGNC